MNVAGVVLSGGQSKRMGTDKSQLKIGSTTLLEHAKLVLVESDITDVFVSGKSGIEDIYTNKGPISGLQASLCSLKQYNYIVFIPVDMPFITKEVIHELIELISLEKTQVAYFAKNNLPLILENNKGIRLLIKKQIDINELSIYKLLIKLNSTIINNGHSQYIFSNTNSPNQWQIAKRKLLE